MTKLIVDFRIFANASKNDNNKYVNCGVYQLTYPISLKYYGGPTRQKVRELI